MMAKAKVAPRGLRVKKLAGEDGKPRVKGYDRFTGRNLLVDPETGHPSPKPLLGVMVQEAPAVVEIGMRWVARAKSEGWVSLEGEKVTHAPGGPESDPWRVTHTFVEADTITIHSVEGDVVYEVVRQPGKYGQAGDPEATVVWSYQAKLVKE